MKRNDHPSCLPYLFICLVILLLYAKTLFFGLTYLDDDLWVVGLRTYLQKITNIFNLFSTIDVNGVYYRPMIVLSFLIDAKLSIFSSYTYRITNILLHMINTCLVFILLKDLKFKQKAALSFSLIFAVHPALVQAVAWIPGRTNPLMSVFILPATISFIRYIKIGDNKSLLFHFIFLLLALLTKETAVILPVVCLVYLFLNYGYMKIMRVIKIFLPVWVIAVSIWFILRNVALGGGEVIHGGMIRSLFANCPAVILYFGKVFLPINLTVLPVLKDSNLWIGAVLIAFIGILLFASKTKNNRMVLFGSFWFIAFLMPAFVHSFTFPEYRLYIPIIGVFIIVHEIGIFKALERFSFRGVVVSVVVLLFLLAYHYTDTYKDRMGFWKNASTHSQSAPMAHANLAYAYHAYGKIDLAREEFEKTLILDPGALTINYNIGVIHYNEREYSFARQSLLKELSINPAYKPAENLLKMMETYPGVVQP